MGSTNLKEPSARKRSRAARLPNHKLLILPVWLFGPLDIVQLADQAHKADKRLKCPAVSEERLVRCAQLLDFIFTWALQCAQMYDEDKEPEALAQGYRQIAEAAHVLLGVLGLNPEQYRATAKELPYELRGGGVVIDGFRQLLDVMVGARPGLEPELDALSRLAWSEHRAAGDDLDTEERCVYRQHASFLIGRLPRTLALLAAMAEQRAKRVPRRGRGKAPDYLGKELFCGLAGAHEAIFGSKPLTRSKTGNVIGGSISWAKVLIQQVADRINNAEHIKSLAAKRAFRKAVIPYTARLRAYATLSDRQISELLDTGWSEWRRRSAA